MRGTVHGLSGAVLLVVALSVVGQADAQDSCPASSSRNDPVDFMTNTATWHDWATGEDFWSDPMGYCRATGTDGGWGYLGHEWDFLYYGSWYDDYFPHDYTVSFIPTPTIQCQSGYRPVMWVRQSDNYVANEFCELLPQPPHTLLPTEIDAWWNVAGMFFGWAIGTFPSSDVYVEGTIQVYQMQTATGIQAAKNYWYNKNNNHIVVEGCHNLEPIYAFDVRFGLKGLIDAGGNATQQFVGSYKVDIIPNAADDGMVTFYVTNITSMTSLLYDSQLAKSWSRETLPPGGNYTQVYTWEERMCGQDH